jgi:hypothetical protein
MLLVFLEIVKEVGILNNMDSNSTVHRKSKDDDITPAKSCFFWRS